VSFLRQSGFERVSNLEGGMQAWARTVDPQMPQY
jgi:rhodanese-related sulfurtransferase